MSAREKNVGSKLKHVDVAHHYCADMNKEKKVSFHQIPSKENLADFWTKPMSPALMDFHRSKWMIKWQHKKV